MAEKLDHRWNRDNPAAMCLVCDAVRLAPAGGGGYFTGDGAKSETEPPCKPIAPWVAKNLAYWLAVQLFDGAGVIAVIGLVYETWRGRIHWLVAVVIAYILYRQQVESQKHRRRS
ncbi:MAG: hypothetical protein ACHREM_04200 [Polyangiales bacterium]